MVEQTNEVLNTIMRRRTVRKFQNKPVPQELMDQLIQAALYAPTRLGKRPWHFIIITDPKVKEALASALPVANLHRRIGRLDCIAHEVLSADGAVQATVFADGTRVVANYAGEPREVKGGKPLAAVSWNAE